MQVRLHLSIGTALTAFTIIALIGLLAWFGKKDWAAGVGAVGVLLAAVLPKLLSGPNPDGLDVKVGKSDPPSPVITDKVQ